ncbi:MAG TPA: hypothetical protein P5514_06560 [Bacteroidales bacterium]|nr:hypothetical protein [Bacteroidales bacterium]HRX96590.1 hypothetical protein [Bacteroidales bacterium]
MDIALHHPNKLVLILLAIFLSGLSFGQITVQSTTTGGLWSDGDSWIGGSAPGINDNVVINGLVVLDVNTTCNNFSVSATGQFRNNSNASYTFQVFGDAENYGVISSVSYIFNIEIHGNIYNAGTWTNSHTFFVGPDPQQITTITAFGSTNLINNKPAGNISSNNSLKFQNCAVDLNSDTLFMTNGLDSLNLNNGHLQEATILGLNAPGKIYCNLNSIAYFDDINIECDEFTIDGSFRFSSFLEIMADVRVEGTFQNRLLSSQVANVYGNITNNGTIKDQTVGWSLYLTGNMINNGNWSVFYTYFSGSADQHLTFNSAFEGENFVNSNPVGMLIASSDLSFKNTNININYDTLFFDTGADSLIINGHYIQNAIIQKGAAKAPDLLVIKQINNAYLRDVSVEVGNIDLAGIVQAYAPLSFSGDVTVRGTLQNFSGNQTVYVNGNLNNQGVITDPFSTLFMHISGNISQNGTWDNNFNYLDGTQDQHINLINNTVITGNMVFDALNAGSPYQWYYEGGILNSADFTGETANQLTWQVPVGSAWFGEFYCETGAGPSRTITVEGGFLADIKLFLEGPYNGPDMNTNLNTAAILPLSQPYDLAPWNYPGTESVASFPANIVDWVLADFRETAGGPETATEATSIFKKALFLRNDGYLVNLDGSREITVGVPDIANNLYVVVYHRNHLPVLSNTALSTLNGVYTYDFTTSASQAYGSVQNALGGGVYGLISGDANADGIISELDLDLAWDSQAGETGYLGGDLNMNNNTNNEDKNEFWYPNTGRSQNLPD